MNTVYKWKELERIILSDITQAQKTKRRVEEKITVMVSEEVIRNHSIYY